MWKKLGVTLIALLSTFSVVYALNKEMNAATTSATAYYGVGEIFRETGKKSFTMGGIEWNIASNDGTGTGYILSDSKYLLPFFGNQYCSYVNSLTVPSLVEPSYQTGIDDEIGTIVKSENSNANIGKLSILKVTEYNEITDFGKDMDNLITALSMPINGLSAWLDDDISAKKPANGVMINTINPNGEYYTKYTAVNTENVWIAKTAVTNANAYLAYKVKLPKKSNKLNYNPVANSTAYGDSQTLANAKFADVSTTGGTQPYTFTFDTGVSTSDDVDQDGNTVPAGTIYSDEFSLSNPTSTTGTSDLLVKSNLNAGIRYIKIITTDVGTDGIPFSPLIVKIEIDKATPTLAFTNTTLKSMKVGDAVFTDTIATSNTEMTSADISYSLAGGVAGVLSVGVNSSDSSKYDITVNASDGLPTTFTLSATLNPTANFDGVTTSINRDIYVFKGMTSFTWNPTKVIFDSSDVSVSGTKVGTLLATDGTGPFTYELVKNTDSMYDPVNGANNGSFSLANTETVAGESIDVKTSSALLPGSYHLQFKVTDTSTNEELYTTGMITVSTKTQSTLDFKDSSGGTIITNTGLTIKFDASNPTLFAEGGTTTNAIEYSVAPDAMQPGGISASSYVSINKTSGLITPIRAGNNIKVQAKRPGNGTYDDITAYMNLTIEPTPQIVDFNDKSSPVNVQIGANKIVDAIGKIKSSGAVGVGSIIYISSDANIATVDKDTGDVTGVKTGTITLTATMNKLGEKNYDSNYDTVTATKTINVYKPMTITWADASPRIKANANVKGNKAGTISVSDSASDPNFAISHNTGSKNKDASLFQIVDNGATADVQVAQPLTAVDWASHGGTFNIQVDVSDTNGVQTMDISITIDEADNDAYFTQDGSKITSLTKKFGENGNTFNLTSKSDGLSTIYSVAPDPSSVLAVSTTGTVTIKSAGTVTVHALFAAGNGYAQKTVSLPVTIELGDQEIAFKDTSTIKRPFVANTTFNEAAELKETSLKTLSARTITYSSNSPSICTIEANGDVTMLTKGTCDISASNSDSDWNTTTANKQISLYDKMSATYSASSPNIKAESNTIGDKVGTINAKDYQSSPTYQISTNSSAQNIDATFFQVIGNGASADLKLAKKITALDWLNHTGVFKVQVEVSDVNGTETKDITVLVDQADNTASFTDNGTSIPSLTKTYGENGNTFNLTTTSSNAGTATYGLSSADTSDTLSVTSAGVVSVNKVGTGSVEATIAAGGGYASKAIGMKVTIVGGKQSIAFKDTSTVNQPFISGSTFSEVAELKETSANTSSTRTVTYKSNSPSICSIDAVGTVTMVAKGTCDISASNSDVNWITTTTKKVIQLYDGMGVTFVSSTDLQAETTTTSAGAKAGSLTVNGGFGSKTYAISTASGVKNSDAHLFKVSSTGIVSFDSVITATQLAGKYNVTDNIYKLYVQIDTSDSVGTTVTTDAVIELKGAPLKAQFANLVNGKLSEVYGAGKTFTLDLAMNKGDGIPTYQLKNDPSMPQDVLLSVDASGIATIQHANDQTFVGNPLKVEAIIPASNGYDDETIEAEVEITPAKQADFAFKTPTIKLGYGATITPTFTSKLSTGTISLSSDASKFVKIDGTDIIAQTSDGTANVTAIDSGDRDYQSAIAKAEVNVSSAPSYSLIITTPSATYGDTGLSATATAVGSIGTNPVLAWSSSDPTIADIDSSGNITIYNVGTVTISCTRTTTGEPSVTSTAQFLVDPKPITVTIDSASKYVGESMPTFNAVIPSSDLIGSDTVSQPTFSCKDGATLVDQNTEVGTYDINGTYVTGSNPKYDITVVKGSLTINQDISNTNWYYLEGVASANTLDPTEWYNEDVKVALDNANAGTYNELSLDKNVWDKTSITVSNEAINQIEVTFRMDPLGSTHPGAISTTQKTSIMIDKTKPVITTITGTRTNKDALSTLLNNLTFGLAFKPGTLVSIESTDNPARVINEVSGVKELSYEVYEINRQTGKIGINPIDTGLLIPDANGKGEVKINDIGLYRVCAIPSDNAGNVGTQNCSDVNIKNIDTDMDGDGEEDFVDSDDDNCPDINIALKDEKGVIYKINVDRDSDGIPDLNIDSDGDGIADINVDTDKDGKPDLNLVILDKWEPTFCAKEQVDYEGNPIEYCTMKDIKAVINVDTGNDTAGSPLDGIPDIDIDTNGDMIADFNITKDGKTPSINIGKLHEWNPKNDCKKGEFQYDTIGEESVKVELNFDSDGDGRPDINLDPKGTGKPTLNIDINGDGVPDVDIDSDGDGIRDVNIDVDGNGIADENIVIISKWIPDKNVDILDGFPYDTMGDLKAKDTIIDEDTGIQIQKPGGSFLPNYSIKVNDVKDSIDPIEKDKIKEFVKDDMEIKEVYDVKLSDGTSSIQPDGSVKVRIPMNDEWKSAESVKVVIEQADGTYKEVIATVKDGYLEYETDFLGKVGIIADKSIKKDPDSDKSDVPIPDFTPNGSGGSTPDKTVKGNYTSGIGGAGTGDSTSLLTLICMGTISSYVIYRLKKKYNR